MLSGKSEGADRFESSPPLANALLCTHLGAHTPPQPMGGGRHTSVLCRPRGEEAKIALFQVILICKALVMDLDWFS